MAKDAPNSNHSDDVTLALNRFAAGDREAANRVWTYFQDDVRRLAESMVWKFPRLADVQATVVIHEVWIRLLGRTMEEDLAADPIDPDEASDDIEPVWANRRHFWGAIARTMERFLIEQRRSAQALKRGGDRKRVPLEIAIGELSDLTRARDADIEGLVAALRRLESLDPMAADVARHRYLFGLTVRRTAECLDVSPRTVDNHWKVAQTRLRQFLDEESGKVPYDAVAI